jgi:thermitase
MDSPCGCDSDSDGTVDSAVGHGTFVAGMVSLVAPAARILPLRVLDGDGHGTVFAVSQAILDAVAAGADVINLSFGTDKDAESKVVTEALRTAREKGVVVVAAAGNQGSKREHFPASKKDVWSVGALDSGNEHLAAFSNRGGWVDLATSGENVLGPVPGNAYARWSGTSVAAPLVAGQAALLTSAQGTASLDKITGWVEQTARKLHGVDIRRGRSEILASLLKAASGK